MLSLLLCWATLCSGSPDPRLRESLMQLEASRHTGGQLLLTEAELHLSAQLQKLKQQEMAMSDFPPALHFFKARPLIQRSPIYRLLQNMPKGNMVDAKFDPWDVPNLNPNHSLKPSPYHNYNPLLTITLTVYDLNRVGPF